MTANNSILTGIPTILQSVCRPFGREIVPKFSNFRNGFLNIGSLPLKGYHRTYPYIYHIGFYLLSSSKGTPLKDQTAIMS